MFEMSVNEVPGWSVLIVPRLIGVPVAFTPGLVPHCEVLTVPDEPEEPDGLEAAAEDEDDPAAEPLELELELHPARTPPTARTAARTAAGRHLR
jgi:hypothetical protein